MKEKTPKYIKIQFFIFLLLLLIPIITMFLKINFYLQDFWGFLFLLSYLLLLTIPHSYFHYKKDYKFALEATFALALLITFVLFVHVVVGSKLKIFGSAEEALGVWSAFLLFSGASAILFLFNILFLAIHKMIIKDRN